MTQFRPFRGASTDTESGRSFTASGVESHSRSVVHGDSRRPAVYTLTLAKHLSSLCGNSNAPARLWHVEPAFDRQNTFLHPSTYLPCYGDQILKIRMKRLADRSDRAVQRLAAIEASIRALASEDLLDLADIFKAEPRTPIGEIAFAELARRSITL
jgi:hypothetical protein